ncbi:MAG: DUF6797 domain-containing protein, partial [Verrucomicrobiales bacterium]
AKQIITDKVLFHEKGSENIEWDKTETKKNKVPEPGNKTVPYSAHAESLPFCSGTIRGGGFGLAYKGIAIKVAKDAAILFDTELLRISAGWTGHFIRFPDKMDGLNGERGTEIGATARFGTKSKSVGWAKDGNFTDPRLPGLNKKHAYGPLDGARYKGLYLCGDRVVLSYRVGETDVLESTEFVDDTFARTIQIGPGSLTALICEDETDVGLVGPGTLETTKDRVTLKLTGPARVKVCIGPRKTGDPVDLTTLIKGGPARWNEPVVTQGTLGPESEAYTVDTLTVPYVNPYKSYMRTTGIDFFSDGRAAIATIDGDVWIVSGIDATLSRLTWKRFATGLYQALGLKIVDDTVYVLGRDQITRLHDLNKDGEADFYENFNNECQIDSSWHEFTHDLWTDRAGNFYYAKGSNLGEAATPHHGTLIKVSKDGKSIEVIATGFRSPNGISVGPNDEITTSDNEGNWTPTTPINWIKKGGFYGHMGNHHRKIPPTGREKPLCWIPHGVDNSGGGQAWVTSDRWGPLKNHLLHLSYGKCQLFHVMSEPVGDDMQGGVWRFPFRFISGSMRARFNPTDGQLYVSGMRGWQTSGGAPGCFQRVRYTGKPAKMPLALHYTKSSIDITFTDPLDRASAADAQNYGGEWFTVKWTSQYGSPEFGVADPEKKGRDPLGIEQASLSQDGKTVSLKIPDLKPAHCVIIKYR